MKSVQLGDVGTKFLLTVKNPDGDIIDVSDAAEKTITFAKPDDSNIERELDFEDDGVDGVVNYVTVEGDIDQAGIWRYQIYVELSDGMKWRSDIHKFQVKANL